LSFLSVEERAPSDIGLGSSSTEIGDDGCPLNDRCLMP